MATTADAVVVGGGVVGASALFHLCALGLDRVILCERRQPGAGATGQSGAFIQYHFCQNAAEARLTTASMPYFQRWDELVGAGSCGFVPAGYLRLEPPEREGGLRARVAMLREVGVASSVVGPDDVARLAPYLRTDGAAVAAYEPGSGYADATGTVAGFLAAAGRRGGEVWAETTVTGVRAGGGTVRGVETSAGPIDAPVVVLAAGAWSPPLLRGLGLDAPLSVALTQCAIFARPAACPVPAMTVGDGVSLSYFRAAGPDAGRILVGLGGAARRPAGDLEGDFGTVPAEVVAAAGERLAARLMGAEGARPLGGTVGPITVTPDDLPIIDRHPDLGGLTFFAGDCGSSFKTGPAIGRALAEWAVRGRQEVADLAAFRLGRFAADGRGGAPGKPA
ncbi:MAG TPA: FAD-binding oxidoreductase [Thermomicrobiales bacterium]|nr:FAD-binding oxidoreductase [Thermomicrobiales bacterium]